jgi:hypothetical protein
MAAIHQCFFLEQPEVTVDPERTSNVTTDAADSLVPLEEDRSVACVERQWECGKGVE